MRKLTLGLVTALTAAAGFGVSSTDAEAVPTVPNIVFILTDDMRADDLHYMPNVQGLLWDQGVSFNNAYAVNPLCCPSRATILTGQYSHNTGVMTNKYPLGGFHAFDDSQSIGVWLQDAGYVTGFIGKYLNQYGVEDPSYIPPGWTTWRATTRGAYDYIGRTTFNSNGRQIVRKRYQTDVVSRMARAFVRGSAGSPFMLFLSYLAPHVGTTRTGSWAPPRPALRHRHVYDGIQLPINPAFNEFDLSDKPASLQRSRLGRRKLTAMRERHERRIESLLAVDEGVAALVAQLEADGVLDDTYIVFTSDNGFFHGEHRLSMGKVLAHEPSSKVPLLVRGPGVPRGTTRSQVVGLHDLAPTFLRWAGTGTSFPIDGIDLSPTIASDATSQRDLLIEGVNPERAWREYGAIRTAQGWKYIEYATGEVEMYNLMADPYEVDNLAGSPSFADHQATMARRLRALRDCVSDTCR